MGAYCQTPPQFCQLAPNSDVRALLNPPLILDAEIAERLAKRVEGAMGKDQRHDIAPPEPKVENAKCKSRSARDKRAMPPLIVSVAIAEER